MSNTTQKLNLKSIVARLLSAIPPKNKEILERRFGLAGGEPETLEAIGQSYKITRERVRQIQEYGLRKLLESEKAPLLAPAFEVIKNYISSNGGIAKEADIYRDLAGVQNQPSLRLILKLLPDVVFAKETDDLHLRYAVNSETLNNADSLVLKMHNILVARKAPVDLQELVSAMSGEAQRLNYKFNNTSAIQNILGLSRRLKKGPFGEYGHAEWPTISPRGVRDKAHLVLEREKRPLHFREITAFIDKYFKEYNDGRITHAQTVHNELIKDPRFVLIGRGLYALADWGYEPGTVKDVLVQVIKENGRAMSRDELFDIVAERRFVKPNTIFLNLQNKNYFKKVEEGKYYLA